MLKNGNDMIDQFISNWGTGLEQAAETIGKLPKAEIQGATTRSCPKYIKQNGFGYTRRV